MRVPNRKLGHLTTCVSVFLDKRRSVLCESPESKARPCYELRVSISWHKGGKCSIFGTSCTIKSVCFFRHDPAQMLFAKCTRIFRQIWARWRGILKDSETSKKGSGKAFKGTSPFSTPYWNGEKEWVRGGFFFVGRKIAFFSCFSIFPDAFHRFYDHSNGWVEKETGLRVFIFRRNAHSVYLRNGELGQVAEQKNPKT